MSPSNIEEEGRRIARQIGVSYTGPQYGKNDEFLAHLFTDVAVTGTTFAANTLQEAIANLAEKRRTWLQFVDRVSDGGAKDNPT